MKRLSGLFLIGVLMLSGCVSTSDAAPDAAQTESPAGTAGQDASDGMKFCEEMEGGMLAYTDFVNVAMTDGVDMTEFAVQERYVEKLGTLVPSEGESALVLYGDLVTQIQDIVTSGGTGTLNSNDFKQGVVDVMAYCVDVGYSVSPSPASEKPELTVSQSNAVKAGQSYLDHSGFSRSGLISQLEYEDYPASDATFAVDYLAPDWNAEAAETAKSYLDHSSFSRQGLIDQLIYEGFSQAEAEYGVTAAGY
jgi:hypothetical protein